MTVFNPHGKGRNECASLRLFLQPEAFLFFGHRAVLDGLGKALLARALLLLAGGIAGLAAVKGDGGLAIIEHGAELFNVDLEELGEACQLLLAQADQFDSSRLDLFPDIDTEPQPFRCRDQR